MDRVREPDDHGPDTPLGVVEGQVLAAAAVGVRAATAASALERARPIRLTVSATAREIAVGQRLRFESWLRAPDGAATELLLAEAVDVAASPVVVTSERVARGAENDLVSANWFLAVTEEPIDLPQ